ncbi:uncharacterized protein SPSK_06770 [Sporothrix schenckii 1099-18]|uniref:Uncharacterized protein n=1 Tax=Sporothrix schenckii 1099-18 TaxID=1397361 RepID=A0A0F2MKD9_SPOSC|nr:uncharacterized protein SPSK_06770 [Sporothrix schenckii 1099-18]KJR89305.1 hypothetical protein SPSK_06770 [Sporothrix schenckii 1099-18]
MYTCIDCGRVDPGPDLDRTKPSFLGKASTTAAALLCLCGLRPVLSTFIFVAHIDDPHPQVDIDHQSSPIDFDHRLRPSIVDAHLSTNIKDGVLLFLFQQRRV